MGLGRRVLVAWIAALMVGEARADLIAHRDKPFFVEGETIRAEFKEDCPDAEAGKEPIERECPWILLITDKATGSEIGRVRNVRLTDIRVTEDERYVVGLSHVQAQDGPHVLVARPNGNVLGARKLVCAYDFVPVCTATISQWIDWYQIEAPQVRVLEDGDTVLAVELNTLRSERFSTGTYEGRSVDEPIPRRFIVPLNCSLSDQEKHATGRPACDEYDLRVPGDYDTPEYGEASEQERRVLGRWFTKNHLDAGRYIDALEQVDRCLARAPDHCACMVKRAAILKALDRDGEAEAQTEKTAGRCW